MYIAIVGSVINVNKETSHLSECSQLTDILNKVNEEYQEDLAVPITMTGKNEFRGLFKDPRKLFELVDKIKFTIFPVELRFGVGLGAVNSEELREGPAYLYAKKAVALVEKETASQLSRIILSAGGDGSEFKLLNDSLKLCDFVESRWRDSQRELVKISLLAEGHNDHVLQSKLASELGISRQAANQRVQSSGYYQFIRLKMSISETFRGIWSSLI